MSEPRDEFTTLPSLLLRTALGDRVDTLRPEQVDALAAEFVRGGAHAVLAQVGAAREAATALAYARSLSSAARERLAAETTPLSEHAFVEAEWSAATSALDTHRDELVQVRGVLGFGPGFRRREGVQVPERCVVVYVERKRTPAQLRRAKVDVIPPTLPTADGTAVPTDVVELGRVRRQAFAGGSIGPAGRSRRGTIGAFVQDLARGGTVALTAMHVLQGGGEEVSDCVSPGHGLAGSGPLGRFRRGTLNRVDAAVVGAEQAASADNTLPHLGRIRGWRPMSLPGDYNRTVQMFGAQTQSVVSGTIVEPIAHLPGENLESAILVRIATRDGDSGAALLDSNNLVVGFLVGEAGPSSSPLRIFTPAGLVLQLLACDLPPA